MHFSEVLKAVKLDSVFLYDREFPQWSFRSPNSCKLAPFIKQSCGRAIVYHLLNKAKPMVGYSNGREQGIVGRA